MATEKEIWSQHLFSIFREYAVDFYGYVPDAGNAELVKRVDADPSTQAILLTTEEEGVALCAGADLVGRRGALLLQSSGVGNCVNYFSLVKGARFPLFMMVTMRGEYGETNPWQYAMGQATLPVLEAMGILCFAVHRADELDVAARASLAAAFRGGNGAALILSQQFLGAKAM